MSLSMVISEVWKEMHARWYLSAFRLLCDLARAIDVVDADVHRHLPQKAPSDGPLL